MSDTDDINIVLQILNSDGSGYFDKEKLHHICPHLSSLEIDTIFNDFDKDHDNRVYVQDLLQSNDYPRDLPRLSAINSECNNTNKNMTHTEINEIFNSLACQEQIFEFYETLRNGSSDSTHQFQSILEVFVCDILKYRKEIKRLEDSYKREKETHEKYLKHIEEDQEHDMHKLEENIREEEQKGFELERQLSHQRTTKEINDLKSTIQRLQTIEQLYIARKNEEDSSTIPLREEIAKLTEENQTLNATLNDTLTANAILQSDLQSFKSQLNERQTMLLQEKQSSSSNHREKESLQTNVRHLVEVNKQLRDENDSLRATIESKKTNTLSRTNGLLSTGRLTSTAGSTLGSYWNNPRLDSPSPSYVTIAHQRKFDSYDLESADELGMLYNGSRSIKTLDVNLTSNKILPLVPLVTVDNTVDENNTMNDSGLSLTTGRDATEVESDRESKLKKQSSTNNTKQYRPLITKRNDDDETDSDDVFTELSLDRNHPKRSSQQRISKRGNNNARPLSKQLITQLPGTINTDKSQISDTQQNLSFDHLFKVVLCGDAAVGKSTLIMRLCKGKFVSNINSTLGVDFQNKQIELDGKRIAVQLWDTAGQERFRSIARSYFRRCDGVILVYDSTHERSFLNVREWLNTITDSTPKKVPVMIVANKIDLRDQMRAEGKRVIEQSEGARLAKRYNALFIETSAKDGTNTDGTLIELARDMQYSEDLERFRSTGIDLDKNTTKKSNCCGS